MDPHPISWHNAALFAKGGGLVLLFVGTLVSVLFGSFPADCFTMTCTGSTSAGVQYGILLARLLWTFGAFGLAIGAGIQRQFVLNGPPPESTEAGARFLADRRTEFWLMLAGIGILLVLLLTQPGAVAPAL
jgi:hypothetical protein